METTSVLVKAQLVCVFETFSEWVNYAPRWIGSIDQHNNTLVCLDRNGYECHIGEQFTYARDNSLFPVTAYILIKNTEREE